MKPRSRRSGGHRKGPRSWIFLALLLSLPAGRARAGLFDDAVSGKLDTQQQQPASDAGTDAGQAGAEPGQGAGEEPAAGEYQPAGAAQTAGAEQAAAAEPVSAAVGSGVDSVSAYDEAPAPSQGNLLAQTAVELNGYVRGTLYAGKVPVKDAGEIKSVYAEPALKLRIRKGSYGDGFAEIRFWSGYQSGEPKTELDLREGYVNVYVGPFDFRLGQQVIVWGRADGFNPTSNLTPMSLRVRSPNEDDQRIGNLALRSFFNLAPFRLEGVWVPLYRPVEIPDLPFPDFVTLEDSYPEPRLANGLGASRLHLELPEVEMSVSYLFGYAPMPGLTLSELENPGNALSVSLARLPYRHHVVGLDFAAPVSDLFGLRGEAAFRRPLHYGSRDWVPEPDLQYVLGVDREFGDLMVIVQYLGRHTFDWSEIDAEPMTLDVPDIPENTPLAVIEQVLTGRITKTNQMIPSQTERWQHSAFLRLQWKLLHETLSLEVNGLYNFSTDEWLARPKLSYDITDALQFIVGGEVYGGPDDTLFGLIEEIQSAGYTQLMASF